MYTAWCWLSTCRSVYWRGCWIKNTNGLCFLEVHGRVDALFFVRHGHGC